MWTRRTVLASGAALLATPAAAADYGEALARAWGGPVSATAAHREALAEVRRLRDRADRLLHGQGLEQGTVAGRIAALFADPRFLYPDDDAGRDQAVAAMNARLAALRPRLARAFGDLAIPEAQVRRMSPADAARGRGGYRDPGVYYVDLKAIGERPGWTLPSVAFHETVPGHALQAALQSADPAKQPYLGVYSEAWATYAEQLAADLGAYADDPPGELGYLHWRLFRMARIVADTGQGALGWTADRAVAAMRDIQGRAVAFTTIEADIARMRQSPGVYAAQGLGALSISRLRPRRPAAWPQFHASILADGPWPCSMLPRRVAKGVSR
ncbi:MAG: DUF885 domain-containing protein [Alphaproteobacteria bacterium]|nr:DUF885 domain-containing protein [Alphaproteobacteria bacterium]MBU1514797.1 DUF885 domain-containing protein [Alphaproteobacteria bacterium]MBU2093928.1 DUF885 domain-containing protein [Alphaproteobacteria bacterium]MBU2153355.1 DUF885 domain-containing protein [Alphaproteobacteria bacterium]MBU2309783.1 DUF885 domain-containing protein [Alphaproteobacteria bacterium]